MSAEKIQELKSKVYDAFEELRRTSFETKTPASITVGHKTYDVFIPELEDEYTVEFLTEEYGIQPGEWISSSERC